MHFNFNLKYIVALKLINMLANVCFVLKYFSLTFTTYLAYIDARCNNTIYSVPPMT